jgi:glutamate decarboxylase
MPLHERDNVRQQLDDCVFVGRDLTSPVPKYRFPRDETPPKQAYQVVADELMLDGNSRQNLATFCQTWVEPEILGLMALSIDKNMIDKDEYPQTAEIEERCVHMLADLWHAPDAANTIGASAIGSSEACMLAGMAAKWRWRAKRQAEGKPTDRPNMVCGPVQVVWHKFAKYWDIEMREVPMSPGRYMMDPASMLERVDENTIMVVPTLGVTYTGSYEPVEAMAAALDQLQADTGLDIDIHVDGASGAFLAPFCAPEVAFDFRLPRVKSISTSGHKFGLAPLGVGWVLWRDREELPDDLIFHVNYLGGDMPVFQINFSRPAGQIIAQYYNFLRLGFEGYKRIHDASYAVGQYLAGEIVKLGPFELLCDSNPATGIPTVTWRIREGEDPGYTLFDLADRLRARGCLYAHRCGLRHRRAAHPGPAGRKPGHGLPAPGRLQGHREPLLEAPDNRAHDEGGVQRVQPPITLSRRQTRRLRPGSPQRGDPSAARSSYVACNARSGHAQRQKQGTGMMAHERPAIPERGGSNGRGSGVHDRGRGNLLGWRLRQGKSHDSRPSRSYRHSSRH